jgi:hypothetical protein
MNTEKQAITTPTVYRVINKSNHQGQCVSDANFVAVHMLGMRISNLIVIKSDDVGDMLVVLTNCDVRQVEIDLKAA